MPGPLTATTNLFFIYFPLVLPEAHMFSLRIKLNCISNPNSLGWGLLGCLGFRFQHDENDEDVEEDEHDDAGDEDVFIAASPISHLLDCVSYSCLFVYADQTWTSSTFLHTIHLRFRWCGPWRNYGDDDVDDDGCWQQRLCVVFTSWWPFQSTKKIATFMSFLHWVVFSVLWPVFFSICMPVKE